MTDVSATWAVIISESSEESSSDGGIYVSGRALKWSDFRDVISRQSFF